MRRKPKYNNVRLVYKDSNSVEHTFYANEVSSSKQVSLLIGMPIQDTGSRYITDSDLVFAIDGVIMVGETTARITALPEITPRKEDNNSRRGYTRKDKVIITT